MATGSGKTFTAANVAYRLVKHADARRILFLVDRANLGRQTLKEFQGFATPDDGRKFTELYNVQHLSSNHDRPGRARRRSRRSSGSTRSCAASRARPRSSTSTPPTSSRPSRCPVAYNPALPPESFDVVIVDECHRSIYGVWRQVLEYFDAFIDRAHRDPGQADVRVLQPEPRHGVRPRAGRRRRRQRRLRRLPDPHRDHRAGLDDRRRHSWTKFRDRADPRRAAGRSSTRTSPTRPASSTARSSPRDQIRTVLETFRDRLFTEIFPGRTRGAEDADLRQGRRPRRGHRRRSRARCSARATTSPRRSPTRRPARKPDDLHRRVPQLATNPRIAVTVDMIATGTDVKPLECVFFMRAVQAPHVLRADEGPRRPRHRRHRPPGRHPRRDREEPLRDRRRRRRHRDRAHRDAAARPQADRAARAGCSTRSSFGVRDPDAISSIAVAARAPRPPARRETQRDAARRARAAGRRSRRSPAGSSPRSTPTASSTPPARATGADEPARRRDRRRGRRRSSTRPSRRSPTSPELRERIVEARRSLEQAIDETSADDRARGRLLEGGDRPRPRHRRVVGALLRGAPRRDHGAPDPLLPAVRRGG